MQMMKSLLVILSVIVLGFSMNASAADMNDCGGVSTVAKKSDFGVPQTFDNAWLIPKAISEAHAKFIPSTRCVGFPIGTPCSESIGLTGDITLKAPAAMVSADPGTGTQK